MSKKTETESPLDIANEVINELKVIEVESPITQWASTGCTLLDIAISNRYPGGGIPLGRIIHIKGATSTSKTVLAQMIMGSVQRLGGKAFLADAENTFDKKWAINFGLDCSKESFVITSCDGLDNPMTIEWLFDIWLPKIMEVDKSIPKVGIPDSLSAMPSESELNNKLIDNTYGMSRAKQLSAAFRKYIGKMAQTNTTLVFIDQTRVNPSIIFGNKETTSGGEALKFYATTSIHLTGSSKEKNNNKKDIGIWINFNIDKNKASTPYRSGKFLINWEYGIDDITSNLSFLKEYQDNNKDITNSKGRVLFDGKSLFVSQAVKHIEENNLEEMLEQEVWKAWQDIYKQEPRKVRTWK
jgi:recombination protein RecA